MQEFLTALLEQHSTRDALELLGLSSNSFGSLRCLCQVYGVEIPQRTNQHSTIGLEGSVVPPKTLDEGGEYKESVEILADGNYRSDKLIRMSEDESKDVAFLLKAHGFDGAEWELLTARNNIWNVYSKVDGVQTLYSSKITVRPLKSRFDIEEIVAAVQGVGAVEIPQPDSTDGGMLELGFVDMHFGPTVLDDYLPTLARTVRIIEERERDEVVLTVGNDLYHNDGFTNQTAKGTVIEGMDYPAAWADATAFYSTIIEAALAHAKAVFLYLVLGNHDLSMAWAFAQMLAVKYPQVTFDLRIEERKVHSYGEVCIGFTHGEKAVKDFDRVFMADFPQFANARVREIHTAHRHHEVTKDMFGIVVRTLSTGCNTDKWHKDNGYVGVNKRFMCFEYEPDALSAIRYA